MGLGRVDDVTLEAAREKARKARNQKWEGLCPLTEQRKTLQANKLMRAKDKTFQQCADDYFNFHKDKWNAKWQLNFARKTPSGQLNFARNITSMHTRRLVIKCCPH